MEKKIEELNRKALEAKNEWVAAVAELENALKEAQLQDASPENLAQPRNWKWPLREDEYERYGRQLIIPSIGIKGQLKLKASSVLIVGAGGLGCPAAAYIAGAGIGTIGLVDGDTVEVSNLHRQIAHSTLRIGQYKVDSAIAYLRELNPTVTYRPHKTHLTPENAEEIVSLYDLVLDCTDHPTSRYLISDACVLLRKPLVSASAFRTDGQLIVLNNPAAPQGSPDGGPCYRCVFPKPPPPDLVVSCGEGGIFGPVVGVMGVMQAQEAIKLIAAGAVGYEAVAKESTPPMMLLFSGTSVTPFRSVRMRGRRKDCFACSAESTLTLETIRSGSLDYVQFCGVNLPVHVLKPEERISAAELHRIISDSKDPHLLLDVRQREHFDVCNIEGSINLPFDSFMTRNSPSYNRIETGPDWIPPDLPQDAPIYVVCRVGNDSQLVTQRLKEMGLDRNGQRFIGDVRGGIKKWKEEVDPTIPLL